MPSILVTPAKGLFQQAGTTAIPNGSISGHKSVTLAAPTSATTTLTAADSGKVILVASNAAAVVLPAVAAGLQFTFIFAADYNTAASTVTAAGSALFIGGGATGAGGKIKAGSDHNRVASNTAQVAGDRFACVCDGTNWFITDFHADGASTIQTSAV